MATEMSAGSRVATSTTRIRLGWHGRRLLRPVTLRMGFEPGTFARPTPMDLTRPRSTVGGPLPPMLRAAHRSSCQGPRHRRCQTQLLPAPAAPRPPASQGPSRSMTGSKLPHEREEPRTAAGACSSAGGTRCGAPATLTLRARGTVSAPRRHQGRRRRCRHRSAPPPPAARGAMSGTAAPGGRSATRYRPSLRRAGPEAAAARHRSRQHPPSNRPSPWVAGEACRRRRPAPQRADRQPHRCAAQPRRSRRHGHRGRAAAHAARTAGGMARRPRRRRRHRSSGATASARGAGTRRRTQRCRHRQPCCSFAYSDARYTHLHINTCKTNATGGAPDTRCRHPMSRRLSLEQAF